MPAPVLIGSCLSHSPLRFRPQRSMRGLQGGDAVAGLHLVRCPLLHQVASDLVRPRVRLTFASQTPGGAFSLGKSSAAPGERLEITANAEKREVSD
jgi:hypothetical protein